MDDFAVALKTRRDLVAAGAPPDLAAEAFASADTISREMVDRRTAHKVSLAVRTFVQDLGFVGATDENVALVVASWRELLQVARFMAATVGQPFDIGAFTPEAAQEILSTLARKELDPLRRAVDDALDLAIERFAPPDMVGDEADHLVNDVLAPFVHERLASGPFASVPIARIQWLVAELYLPEAYGLLPEIACVRLSWGKS